MSILPFIFVMHTNFALSLLWPFFRYILIPLFQLHIDFPQLNVFIYFRLIHFVTDRNNQRNAHLHPSILWEEAHLLTHYFLIHILDILGTLLHMNKNRLNNMEMKMNMCVLSVLYDFLLFLCSSASDLNLPIPIWNYVKYR